MPETKAQIQARIDKYTARLKEIDGKMGALQKKRDLVADGILILQGDLAKASE